VSRFDHIIEKKMTRKEFLGTMGLGLMALLGISSVMAIFSGNSKQSQGSGAISTYGISTYGGTAKKL
jgi:hypothetical protein